MTEEDNTPKKPADPIATFEEIDTDKIPSTDIQFECPYCGKSLSIDQRGAGLVIECTACGQLVTVPIPEGMEISDVDLTPKEQEVQLSNLRVMLNQAQTKAAALETENRDLREQVIAFQKQDATRQHRRNDLRSICTALTKSQTEMAETLSRLRRFLEEG